MEPVKINRQSTDRLLRVIPTFVLELWTSGINVIVGGSYVRRAIFEEEPVRDIDIYGGQRDIDAVLERYEPIKRGIYSVDVKVPGCPHKVNVVDKKLFANCREYIDETDLTICAAALCYTSNQHGRPSAQILADPRWQDDVRDRRIVYRHPIDRPSPNTLIRVLRLYERGYHIAPEDLAKIVCGTMACTKTVSDNKPFVPSANLVDQLVEVFGDYTVDDIIDEGRS